MAYIGSHQGQAWLLPPSIEELIPEDHICYLVSNLVESLDYRKFDAKYAGAGRPAYHPQILLKILIMGVLDKVRSSRALARSARENVVYMYLSEKVTPDFRTISDFRKDNPELVKDAFKKTVGFAKQEGMLDLSHLATDGSKIKANASSARVVTKEELEVLTRFVEKELETWAQQDKVEDEKFGDLRGYDQLPEGSRKAIRKAAINYLKKQQERESFKEEITKTLERACRGVKEDDLGRVNTTDPDSRFMKNKSGRIEPSYNPQVTVERNGIIVANDVCQDATDYAQLQPQVTETIENVGELPREANWNFDSGYFEGGNLEFLEKNNIDAYIPDPNDKKEVKPYDKRNFTYDPAKNEYTCPENQRLIYTGTHFEKQKQKEISVYKGLACLECGKREECTKSKTGIRIIKRVEYEEERNAMVAKMKTREAKEIFRLRAQTVEPTIGDIKENKGVRSFLTRGITAVRSEFNLVCTAVNLKRIWLAAKPKNKPNQTKNKPNRAITTAFDTKSLVFNC